MTDITEVRSETPGLMLIRIASSTPPVYFIIDQPFYEHNLRDGPDEHRKNQTYWLEEHTCPTNVVPVELIIVGDDTDPHGVFEFVDHVLKPNGWDGDKADFNSLVMLFPALGGEIVEGTLVLGNLLGRDQ